MFVLCDGMGGHGHGEVASRTVGEAVNHYLVNLTPAEYTAEMLQESVDYALSLLAKADIYNDAREMGTTLVVVAINKTNILVGHIGDSRAYLFTEEGLRKFRTKDHSLVQEAVDAEILTEDEAWDNPKKNIVTRCLTSGSSGVRLDVDKLTIADRDRLLICTDGLTDALRDTQLQSILMDRDIEDASEKIRTECEMASHDNFSMILMSLRQDEECAGKMVRENEVKNITRNETKPAYPLGKNIVGTRSTVEEKRGFFLSPFLSVVLIIAILAGIGIWMICSSKEEGKVKNDEKGVEKRIEDDRYRDVSDSIN